MTTPEGVSIEDRMGALFTGPQDTEEAPVETADEPVEETEEVEAVADEIEDDFEDETVEEGEEAPEDSGQSTFQPITGVADGVEFTVDNEDEARRLIQFGKTFTQRNQALIEEKKQLEPMKLELAQARDRYAGALPQLQEFMESAIGSEPDPSAFEDRSEYLWAKDQWNQARSQLQVVMAERKRVEAEQRAENDKRLQAWRAAAAEKLTALLPEWADPKAAKSEIGRISEYGQLRGLSPEELGQIHDSRFVMILRDAMRYHELESSGKTKAKEAKAKVKTAKPQTAGPRKRGSKLKDQRERLRKTGREADAAPLMEAIFSR